MMRVEARAHVSPWWSAGATITAALLTLAVLAIAFTITATPLLRGFILMANGALGSLAALEQTIARSALLILTGLAASIAFRIKLYNFGAPGQAQAGALAALTVVGAITLPVWFMLPIILLAGAFAGMVLMLVPAVLKVGRGIDEAVVTLLFNVIMTMIVSVVLVNTSAGATVIGLPSMISLPLFSPELGAYGALLLAVLAAVGVFVLLDFTLWGFDIRAITGNAAAARFAGIPVSATLLRVGLISGALAGLSGACLIALLSRQGIADLLPRVGYAGIVAAMLAMLSPLAVVFAALFLAAVLVGIESISRTIGLPILLADVVVGLMLVMTVLGDALVRYRVRWIRARKVAV